MRHGFAVVLVLAAACGGGSSTTGDDVVDVDAPVAVARGFQVVSPDIAIAPGVEITQCYYFTTPNTEPMAIKGWKSDMTPGSHHMIMFMTDTQQMPDGTVTPGDCGLQSGTSIATWTYAAQMPTAAIQLPSDDGTGKPLAQEIPAHAHAYFQMHYLNATDQTIMAHVTLDAEALDAGAPYTPTAAYVTYNPNLSIPAGATGLEIPQTCDVPAGAKFWLMSTHAHKQAVRTVVRDGDASGQVVFESTDWEHPGAALFMTPSTFYSFTAPSTKTVGLNSLTFACTYDNPSNRTIEDGNSAATDEMCMASGYYFPATHPRFCFNGFLFP
ncbi:MAG: hypothetical protein H6Q90_5713 [Deltaproteobacteria bacterium]|nr:hypothetical protein [Deltaproteobacteria bacterium]